MSPQCCGLKKSYCPPKALNKNQELGSSRSVAGNFYKPRAGTTHLWSSVGQVASVVYQQWRAFPASAPA